ncbi:DUF3089 domain-containing protein [Arsenicibacter rosenii]|uniref:DUF3089 domain-containing protein n=1 Tax=Arsenicibacter rosenii TaxID=1750698 RepID=UPI001E333A05|nr:DUF3089 domain-containing protein [Arsenicibacter rosenii]
MPDRQDAADSIPAGAPVQDGQKQATADVFFIHPTIYTGKPQGPSAWNADVADAVMNKWVDQSTILNQASVFNGSCRVFAPRYRQAHYYSFLTKNKADKEKALELAYEDVKAAFLYYMNHHNRDAAGKARPIIIAAHSQGTVHARRLLAEFFDDKPLKQQLIVAYLVGIATPADIFKTIPAGEAPDQTGCFVSWNTFSRNYVPAYYTDGLNKALCTNPLTWSSSDKYAEYSLNKGGVGPKFNLLASPADAQVHDGLLWIGRLHVPGAALLRTKIWHRADYNLFWMNIRENVAQRIQAYRLQAMK